MAEVLGVMLPVVERLAKLRPSEGVLEGESFSGEEWRLSSSAGVERPLPFAWCEGDGECQILSFPLEDLLLRFLGVLFSIFFRHDQIRG